MRVRRSSSIKKEQLEELYRNVSIEVERYRALKDVPFSFQLWQRIPKCNLKLQELKPNYYYDTLKLIEDYYMIEEPLFQKLNIKEDRDSIQSVKSRVLKNLKDSTSIIALNEGNFLEVVGVLILVEVSRNYYNRDMSREDLVHGPCHKKYVQFTNSLVKDVDIYSMFECFTFLRIYGMCIKPSYRHIGLGIELFETAVYIAQSLKIPVLMGVFTDSCMQVLAEKIGMKEIKTVKYSEWKSSEGDQLFTDLRMKHKTCSLMAGRVHFPPPPTEPVAQPHLVKFSEKSKKKKKKKNKTKKKKK